MKKRSTRGKGSEIGNLFLDISPVLDAVRQGRENSENMMVVNLIE